MRALAAETRRALPRRPRAALRLQLPRGDQPPGRRVGQPPRDWASGRSSGRRRAPSPRGRRHRARPHRHARRACSTAGRSTRRSTTRAQLQPGDRLDGPAIVEEFGSTTVVYPGQRVEVDRFANMVLTRAGGPRRGRAPDGEADPIVLEIVRGHARLRRGRGRSRHRAHLALADDPRGPRLPRRHPRPPLPQAHRALLLGAGPADRARLPDRRRCGPATCSSTTTSTSRRAASATCPISA